MISSKNSRSPGRTYIYIYLIWRDDIKDSYLDYLSRVVIDVDDRALSAWVLEQTYANDQVIHVEEQCPFPRIGVCLAILSAELIGLGRMLLRRPLIEVKDTEHYLFIYLPLVEVLVYALEV